LHHYPFFYGKKQEARSQNVSEEKKYTRIFIETLSNGHIPSVFGGYTPMIPDLLAAYQRGGAEAFAKAFAVWKHQFPELEEVDTEDSRARSRFLTSGELDELEPPTWLVENIICIGEVTVVAGPSDSGKTFIAVDITNRVAQHYRTCYIAAEDVHGIKVRRTAWHNKFEMPEKGNFFTLAEPLNLTDNPAVLHFINDARAYQFKLIVVDTLSQCAVGADENSNKDMGVVMANLNLIAHWLGAAVVIIHHTSKGNDIYRGASVIKANAYGLLNVRREDDRIVLSCERIKNSPGFSDIYMGLVEAGESCVLMKARNITNKDRPTKSAIEMLEHIVLISEATQESVKTTDLQRSLHLSGSSFYRPLRQLRKLRLVEAGSPLRVTAQGKEYLAANSSDPVYRGNDNEQEAAVEFTINENLQPE
jgi:hypothetical protein